MMPDRLGSERRLRPVWQALADPTRRAVLDLLREGAKTTGQLAGAFPVSRFGVMKHLRVLVDAGLVVVQRRGRERWNHLNAVPLREIYERWVRPYEAHWASRVIGLAEHVEGAVEVAKQAKTKGAAKKPSTKEQSTQSTHAAPAGVCGWTTTLHEVKILAPADRVWRALTEDIGRWWCAGFHALPQAKGMRLEPMIGGKMYEHADDGSAVVWFTVIGIEPGRSMDLAGHVTVSFGGPALALLRFDVVAAGKATIVKVAETRIGEIPKDCVASTKGGWRALLDGSLKPFCERDVTAANLPGG